MQDVSPLENHHVSSANLLVHSNMDLNFTKDMLPEDESILRSSIIELVLATVRDLSCLGLLEACEGAFLFA